MDLVTLLNELQPVICDERPLTESYALQGKNVGCCVQLRGKVVLMVFLVSDSKSSWDPDAEKMFFDVLWRVCNRLTEESGLPENQLSISYAHSSATVPYEVTKQTANRMVRDVLQAYQCQDTDAFHKLYTKAKGQDEVCVSFVLNRPFRSFAQRIVAQDSVYKTPSTNGGSELSVVSFRRCDLQHSEHSLLHELLHQFGAVDYYQPPEVARAAKRYFPGSIMDTGLKIDQLTRYIIGWDDTLSPDSLAFLRQINSVPREKFGGPPLPK